MRLGDVLDEARRRTFVGRDDELTRFGEALSGSSPRRVFLVHGVGGIGKSTLLDEFRARAVAVGRPAVLLDGREMDPSPEAVRAALARAAAVPEPRLGELAGLTVLLDHYETLAPFDSWVRVELLPELPADGIAVLAGRDAPAPAWRRLRGWRELGAVLRLDCWRGAERGGVLSRCGGELGAVLRLDCWSGAESPEFLSRSGVAPEDRPTLVQLSRGHPLALALLADAAGGGELPRELADAPDLVSTLLEGVVPSVPGETYATGLATCTVAWATTEDLLAEAVGSGAAPAIWDWLARQPYVTCGARGLVLHDLARDVLTAELERRSPDRMRRLHRLVHDRVGTEVRTSTGPDREHAAQQLLYLHRHSPVTTAIWTVRSHGSAAVHTGTREDHPQVVARVERLHGPANAELTRRWLAEVPDAVQVVRQGGRVTAFAVGLLLPTGSPLERQDPIVRTALAHAERIAPARPGERIHVMRCIGGADGGERDPYAVLVSSVAALTTWLTQPLAWAFAAPTDEEFWGPFFDYIALQRISEVAVGGRRSVLHGIDWRRLSPDRWMDLMNDRERTGATGPPPAHLL